MINILLFIILIRYYIGGFCYIYFFHFLGGHKLNFALAVHMFNLDRYKYKSLTNFTFMKKSNLFL